MILKDPYKNIHAFILSFCLLRCVAAQLKLETILVLKLFLLRKTCFLIPQCKILERAIYSRSLSGCKTDLTCSVLFYSTSFNIFSLRLAQITNKLKGFL